MDGARRERIRVLVGMLGSIKAQVHDLWIEEEAAFDSRSGLSKETRSGDQSNNAVQSLENATGSIQVAIDELESASQ
jgi:hypothetical protein